MYDSRIGRWLSGDALRGKYPHLSPYNFAASNPILLIDPDGNIIEPAPGMTEGQKTRYEATMKKVTERLPDLIAYLSTVRVHEDDNGKQTFVVPGQEGYEKAFDVVIQVSFANIDGVDVKQEKEANEGDGFGGKTSFGSSRGISAHLDGVTKSVGMKYIGITQDRKQVYVDDPAGGNPFKKDINSEADLKQPGSRLNPNISPSEGGKAHFEITIDDYVTPGTSDGAVFSHEFGHVEGILKNFANFVMSNIKSNSNSKGHDKGDLSGEKAVEREKQYGEKK